MTGPGGNGIFMIVARLLSSCGHLVQVKVYDSVCRSFRDCRRNVWIRIERESHSSFKRIPHVARNAYEAIEC